MRPERDDPASLWVHLQLLRSGTSTMADMLRSHPGIAMGVSVTLGVLNPWESSVRSGLNGIGSAGA